MSKSREFKAQKAIHLHEELAKKRSKFHQKESMKSEVYMLFEKYDGWYCYIDMREDKFHVRSRAGRVVPALQWIAEELQKVVSPTNGVLVAEALLRDETVFAKLNGRFNQTKRGSEKEAYLKVHDYVNMREDKKDTPFYKRYDTARALVNRVRAEGLKFIEAAEPLQPMRETWCKSGPAGDTNLDLWNEHAEQVWARGGEGIIAKNARAAFSHDKRNNDLVKIKRKIEADLLVTGVYRGKGKYQHTTGFVTAKDGLGRVYTVSGMTDKERCDWWESPAKIIGKVIEVEAMERLSSGKLREVVYKAVRHDKNAEDIEHA